VGAEGPGWPQPGADYSSWSGDGGDSGWIEGAVDPRGSAGGADPNWSYPGADHPSWPAGAGGADWPQPGADYPGWPADAPGGGWAPERGGSAWSRQEAPVAQHHDERRQTARQSAPVASAPLPATRSGYPAKRYVGAHAKTWSAQLARTQDTATQTYYELAFGDGRLQVMLTEPPKTAQAWASGGHARPLEADDLRNSDAVQVAERILSDADYQAAEIQRAASAQATAVREAAEAEAAEIRQQAAGQAAAIREAAEAEAAEIRQQAAALQQQATDQAAAIREAAEREAAEMRAAAQSMSGELHRVAAYVTQNLATPGAPPAALPATAPNALPAGPGTKTARPVAKPARPGTKTARPVAKPARPGTKPASPVARPTTKPANRQAKVMRKMAFAVAAVSVIGAISGTTELAMHGFPFFVLRANGAGAGETGPKEPVNPELPQKAGEVQCSLLHLACTLK
jgi:hypothetical protein